MDKVRFFTPSKTARSTIGFELAMRQLMFELFQRKMSWEMEGLGRGSVAQARDRAANRFRSSDCTKFVQLDDDLIFDPKDLLRLVAGTTEERPVTACIYPTRGFEWSLTPEILKRGLPLVDWLSPLVMDPTPGAQPHVDAIGTWLEMDLVGGGFMCFHRSAFDRMEAALRGVDDDGEFFYDDEEDKIEHVGFFRCGIYKRRRESEDGAFCRRWRKLCGPIHALMDVRVSHQQEHVFQHSPLFAPPPPSTADSR